MQRIGVAFSGHALEDNLRDANEGFHFGPTCDDADLWHGAIALPEAILSRRSRSGMQARRQQ
jgi:hypothetical protein